MEKVEWFASFRFGNVEILISQRDVAESGYTGNVQAAFDAAGEDGQIFFLDDFVRKKFGIKSGRKIVSTIRIKADFPFFVVSSVVPQIARIALEEFGVLAGNVGKKLYSCGIIAFRFDEDKIQYLVNMKKLLEKEYA